MQYLTVNGYTISRLTLGTVQLGMDYGIHNMSRRPSTKKSLDMIKFALQAGINTLDTARDYGDAEQIIGEFMAGESGKETIVITKFKISSANLRQIDRAWTEVYESVCASLSALRLNRIPICLFHKGKDQSIELVMEILPKILTNLVDEGLIDIGGISVYYPDEVRYTLDHNIIKAIQVPMNVFDQRLRQSGLLQQMYSRQKLIFIRSIYLKGLFFTPPERLKGNLMEAGKYLQMLHNIANQSDMSVAQLVFSYVRDMEEVTSIVFGADNVEQIQQNVHLLQGRALNTTTRQTIEEVFQSLPESIIIPGLWTT